SAACRSPRTRGWPERSRRGRRGRRRAYARAGPGRGRASRASRSRGRGPPGRPTPAGAGRPKASTQRPRPWRESSRPPPRAPRRHLGECPAALARRDDVRADVAEGPQPPVLGDGAEPAQPAPRHVLEEDALDRVPRAEVEDLLEVGLEGPVGHGRDTLGLSAMPIHIRAEPGEYAEDCLLPGDPLRAKYIAETYLDGAVQRNAERGMLGYTGTVDGKPVSV